MRPQLKVVKAPVQDPGRSRGFVTGLVDQFVRRALALDRIARTQEYLSGSPTPAEFARRALAHLQVQFDAPAADLARIPPTGPAIVVANHPYGGLEGLYLAACLLERRTDVRILANHLLQSIIPLRSVFIPVDPFGGSSAIARNRTGLRQALRHVADGGLLVMFPAGAVSHLQLDSGRIVDPPWNITAARLVRHAGCGVIPVHFAGANSAFFQLAGLVSPALRTALLPREILNKRRHRVQVTIGTPITAERLAAHQDDGELAAWLRIRTYGLAEDSKTANAPAVLPLIEPITPAGMIEAEIASLPPSATLVVSGEFRVLHAQTDRIPFTMQEIGRLREVTFRAAGEGTGAQLDLDRYDDHYVQLIAWNEAKREIVGGYRIGRTDEILKQRGIRDLYSHSLFAFGPRFLATIGPALELGRSFVRPEYQRSYSPLLLMWRGICAYVLRHPRYRSLFGPVSISSDYRGASRELLVRYLERSCSDRQLGRLVRPRRALRRRHPLAALGQDISRLTTLDDVSELVTLLESDGKGVPVLLRHYLKVGGRLLGFNVDRHFNEAIDGLIVVDLPAVADKVLQRYMGREEMLAYKRHHAQGDATLPAFGSRPRSKEGIAL